MSRTSRHRILAAMLSACLLSLLGGCTPLTVLAVLGGCKDGGSNGSSGGTTGSVTTGEVRDGMTIAQTKAWFNGSDGPDNVCQAYPDGQCTWWACMRGHKIGLDVGSYWGNGGDWAASATAAGWKTTRTDPVAGSIVSYPPGVADADTLYGHVAIVEGVDAKAGTVTISEMNGRGGLGIVNHRTHRIDVGAVYILPNGSVSTNGSTGTDSTSSGSDSSDSSSSSGSSSSSSDPVEAAWTCSSSASGSTDVVVDYDGDGTHATPEQARAIARKMIASYKDWGDGDYDALVWLWNKESGWQWNATNPSSGAYGIPQALPASKLASAGDDWKDNAATQIKWGLNYIAGRYGSPSAAKTFWLAHNWY